MVAGVLFKQESNTTNAREDLELGQLQRQRTGEEIICLRISIMLASDITDRKHERQSVQNPPLAARISDWSFQKTQFNSVAGQER